MGSRRTLGRSFSNGRSSNGNDVSGSSRLGGYSYLSNVRPENRSTLCSVMAQLMEETQPSFQTTLKSKAVSENCNVKFSCVVTGYPTPHVIWYKDDTQLDRFCGLPKYEIFRNGQNHSLHIYNCTMEDAAIYQASASNTKGIVSCSGVLEVGEMNEFRIHQRYFGKLKQKAENRRREVEGKENQEPLRTISPDRTQRKRRSAIEAFLSAPNSVEDAGSEENHHAVAVESEERLQETTFEQLEETPVQMSNGAVSDVTRGPVANENGSKGGTYIFDSVQKIFTALQPQTPFVKKKIKMSNGSKVSKADIPGDKVTKEEPPNSVAPVCKKSLQRNSDVVMEVENDASSTNFSPGSMNFAEHPQKSVHKIAKDENLETVTLQREQRPGASASTHCAGEGRHTAKSNKASEGKENLEKQIQRNHMTFGEPQQCAEEPKQHLTGDIPKAEDLTPMDIDEKSKTDVTSSNMCESRTALPQYPCKQTGDQLLEKETSSCQKNASVPQPALLSEVTQDHKEMSRNHAPVNLGQPPDQCLLDAQPPQKTLFEGEATTDDTQSPAVHRSLQAPTVKMTQETQDHSRGSNESHTALFTDLQKSPLKSPSGVEKTQGYNVSPSVQQSQVDTPIKSVEGTEIQVDEKVVGNDEGKLSVQADSVPPKEGSVSVATEKTVTKKMEQTRKMRHKVDTDVPMNTVKTETQKTEAVINIKEDPRLELQKETPTKLESTKLHLPTPQENVNSADQQISFQEISKPATKIISIAELLRSQIRALNSAVENSLPTMPISTNVEPPIFTNADSVKELRHKDSKCTLDVRKQSPDRKTETSIDDKPMKNIKETLMEIYDDLNKSDRENIQTSISPHVQTLEKPLVIPPISITDTGAPAGGDSTAKKCLEGIEVGKKTETLASLKAETENVKNSFDTVISNEKLNKRFLVPQTNLSSSQEVEVSPVVPHVKASNSESIRLVSEHATKEVEVPGKIMRFVGKTTPEINPHTKPHGMDPEETSNQCKTQEYSTTTSCLQGTPKVPMKTEHSTDADESSTARELTRSHSLTNPNSEASPLSKRRNCVSPIPSATPQELASGARRKILVPKANPEEVAEVPFVFDTPNQKKELTTQSSTLSSSLVASPTSPGLSRRSPLLQPTDERTSPAEKRRGGSPLVSRRMTAELSTPNQQPSDDIQGQKPEEKLEEKEKHDPRKAPQVIRKIRGETFADASGHLKLWCQFFNILSDSTIRWYKNQVEIAHMKRKAADESQASLAIVQASSKDTGAYRCTITNEFGSDSTDFQLNADLLAGLRLREDIGVGEEIEMMPLVFNKGVADSGIWGNKFFGRVMMEKSRIGEGCGHKVWRAKVIYGLEPVFESGNTCIIKARNPIAYGGKEESCLTDRNLDFVQQECKIQNLAREYCKIFSAEARVLENFGPTLEIIPVYLMFRPANTVPYATVEADLSGVYRKYAVLDGSGRMDVRTGSDVEQKCCALQHWIFQWTNGNLLLSKMEGVDTKITNVGISAKSTGHQGLPVEGNPKVFEQFVSQHQCNYFCGLLGLRSLKVLDSLMAPAKPRGSKSPLLQRKMAAGSSSPQNARKAANSPRVPRKAEQEGSKTSNKIPQK